MKTHLPKYHFSTFVCGVLLLCHSFYANCQTTLFPGDIAFVGVNTDGNPDGFSFVLLTSVDSNTSINFTDCGWDGDGFSCFPGDNGYFTWTAQSSHQIGEVIEIQTFGVSNSIASEGFITGDYMLISSVGDQIFAFQGEFDKTAKFISAIHFNAWPTTTELIWDGDANSNQNTVLPAVLTNGINAIWVYDMLTGDEVDNAIYNCSSISGTKDYLTSEINNLDNWSVDNSIPFTQAPFPCSFTVTPNLAFTEYNSVDNKFSFILMEDISSGTTIQFTDNGWTSSQSFLVGEGIVEWMADSDLSCGTQITINGLTANNGSVTGSPLSLSNGGDQIFAYQGTFGAPTLIAAIDVSNGWDADATDENTSSKPTYFTNLSSVIELGDVSNYAQYNCLNDVNTIEELIVTLTDSVNWIKSNNPVANDACSITCKSNVVFPVAISGGSMTTCESTVSIDGSESIASSYKWSILSGAGVIEDTTSPQTTISGLVVGETQLLLEVTNQGFVAVDTITISVKLSPEVYDYVSPNGDGNNDYFFIEGIEDFEDHILIIYNEWGQQLLTTRNYQNDWKGQDLLSGTYYYNLDPGNGCPIVHGPFILQK